MTCPLSSVPTWHRSVQLKLNSDVNWTIKLSQNQVRASAKQNGIRWCQQCNKSGTIGRTDHDLLKGFELTTYYVKNTTSVSSCDLEQVAPTKYPNQKYVYKRNNANIACQLLHQIDDNKTRMKWRKILVSAISWLWANDWNLTKYD